MKRTYREDVEFYFFSRVHRGPKWLQERWRDYRVAKLAAHAAKNVPMWKSIFIERGIDSSSIVSSEDLRRLPVTSKRTYVGRMVEEIIDNSRLQTSHWFVTSGTSGQPFQFLMSDTAMRQRYIDFATLRFMWWRGEPQLAIENVRHVRIKIRGESDHHNLFVPVGDVLGDMRGALTRMHEFRAEIISAYPSILLAIARAVRADPSLPRLSPRYIVSFGEMLSPALRALISETFNCDVYDRYGLEEIGVIGVECAFHEGFHVNTESVAIEIADDEFHPVVEGEEGRLIATDLLNMNMPFIRYDTGDRARLIPGTCKCGLVSPRIAIEGRYTASLTFGNRLIHHLEFDGTMDVFMHRILQYQIVKTSPEAIEIRIIAGPHYEDAMLPEVIDRVSALVGVAVSVRAVVVPSLPITPRGKCRIISDESV